MSDDKFFPVVALDYDGTFSTAPTTWATAVKVLKQRGFVIVGITMRYEEEKNGIDPLYFDVCDVVHFTGRRGKLKFCEEHNIPIHIWIDDRPDFILGDAIS